MPNHSRSAHSRRSGRRPDADGGATGGGYGEYRSGDAEAAPRPGRAQTRAAARARAQRKRRVRNGVLGLGSVVAVSVLALAGLLDPHGSGSAAAASAATGAAPSAASLHAAHSAGSPTPSAVATPAGLSQLPGLGASFRAPIPAGTDQVLIATGPGVDTTTVQVTLYTRDPDGGWTAGATWHGHNGDAGWIPEAQHTAGDLRSPIGVFTLTDAGGQEPDPGTKLPYDHSVPGFVSPGTGFDGESLADAFHYVIAINYNHVAGTSPLSTDWPLGVDRGHGIWIHVDHGGPTHACISLPEPDMVTLLRTLDPAKHPVIVMGDAPALAG
jgi:L,D-peptidoglycan transpeptidase YkuD (ErfK/YbiS/YcfS/YnhG family)